MIGLLFFLQLNNIPLGVYIPFLKIHSCVGGHLGDLHNLAVVDSASLKICIFEVL